MEKLIQVKNIKKYFPLKKKYPWSKQDYLKAVDDISFDIYKGETLGIVGESGSGKSTLGKCITNIYPATEGKIFYNNREITGQKHRELSWFRENIQAIFQDPYSSLNPKLNVFDLVAEPLRIGNKYTEKEIEKIVYDMLDKVGINKESIDKKPSEFSGGQRQRISIARAIGANPEFILCDEPISALDVSIQAQIVNLLEDLQKELDLTYLFIAHDLSMVRHISHRTMVMYLGNIVEIGNSDEIYNNPIHPYTKGLLNSVLDPIPKKDKNQPLNTISSDIPSPIDLPKGCVFNKRCDKCMEKCKNEKPKLVDIGNGHQVACFLLDK